MGWRRRRGGTQDKRVGVCMCVYVCNFPVDGGVRARGADQAEGRSTISVVSCLVQRVVVSLVIVPYMWSFSLGYRLGRTADRRQWTIGKRSPGGSNLRNCHRAEIFDVINWVSETGSTTYTKLRIKGEALGQLRAWESRYELLLSCSTEVCDKITARLAGIAKFYGDG